MIKKVVKISDAVSATMIALQIPLSPKIIGRINIAPSSKISVLMNEMIADITPLFSAVKKEDPKILNPHNKNDTA